MSSTWGGAQPWPFPMGVKQLRKTGAIRKFKDSELDHYAGFQQLMVEIRDTLEMSHLNLRQFDKVLWIIGKQQRELADDNYIYPSTTTIITHW